MQRGRQNFSKTRGKQAAPVDVRVHSFTLNKLEPQKVAQAPLIPGVHDHKNTLAHVGAVASGLIVAELFDGNAILADKIEETMKKSSGIVFWAQIRRFLEQNFKILDQCNEKFVNVVLPQHLHTTS